MTVETTCQRAVPIVLPRLHHREHLDPRALFPAGPCSNIAMHELNGLLDWWRRHSLISLLITGGALAGAIPKYIELIQRGVEWLRNRRAKKIERYIPGQDRWERVINSRFGFAFSYPRAWGRHTSTNND